MSTLACGRQSRGLAGRYEGKELGRWSARLDRRDGSGRDALACELRNANNDQALKELGQQGGSDASGRGSDQDDHVVIVPAVIDPADPGRIRWARVGEWREPGERPDEDKDNEDKQAAQLH
jgi:hypothetical protein